MNNFDLLIFFLIIVGMVYGAMRGTVREIIGLFSVWLALILDLWLYRWLSTVILQGSFPSASPVVMDTFAFIILMIIFTLAVNLVFVLSGTSPEDKRKKRVKHDFNEMLEDAERSNFSFMNAFGGMIVGAFVTAFWMSVFFALLEHLLRATAGAGNAVAVSMAGSRLLPIFKFTVYWIYQSIQFFTPGDIPAIFQTFL